MGNRWVRRFVAWVVALTLWISPAMLVAEVDGADDSGTISASVSGPSSVAEGNTAVYTVSLSNPSGVDVTLAYSTSDGEATAGQDYVAASGSLTFLPGETTRSVSVSTTADNRAEDEEDFTFLVSDPQPETVMVSSSSSVTTGIISDDPSPTSLILTVTPSDLGEGDEATDVTVTAAWEGPSTLDQETLLTLSLSGTATADVDYETASLPEVAIPAGSSSGSATIRLSPTEDLLMEGDETIIVEGTASGVSVTSTVITINDNESAPEKSDDPQPQVPIETSTTPAPEPEAPADPPAKTGRLGIVTVDGSLQVGLDWDAVDGAAHYLVRWRSVDSGEKLNEGVEVQSTGATITVADYGEWVVRVQACNDAGCGKPLARKFNVVPGPPPAPDPVSDPVFPPAFTLTVSPDRLYEDAGKSSVVVTAAWAGSVTRSEDTTIAVSLSGAAEAPADYTAEVGELVIAAGESNGTTTLSITPVDDGLGEGAETILVTGAAGGFAIATTIALADKLVTSLQGGNTEPSFSGPDPVLRWIPENSPADTAVGDPVTATEPDDGDTLSYSLSGADSASFTIDGSGQIKVANGVDLDYEGKVSYLVKVNVSDGKDGDGNADPTNDDQVGVVIKVSDVKPPLPPVLTVTPSADGGGMRVDWTQQEEDDRAPVTDFRLRYRELGTFACDATERFAHILSFEAAARTATIPPAGADALKPGVVYCVKVEAASVEGNSLGLSEPRTNTLPTSADFTVSASPARPLRLSADDFPYADSHDTLGRVKILSLPAPDQGRLRLDAANVAINQFIEAGSLNRFSFLPAARFTGGATFSFQVEDSHGALTDAHTATIDLAAPAITGVDITSSPAVNNTYVTGETAQVTVTWDQRVSWDITATGAAVSVDLEVGDHTRTAALVSGGQTAGKGTALTFEYHIQSTDTDADGVSVIADANAGLVRLGGGATLTGPSGRAAGRSYDSPPEDDSLHKVDGTKVLNRAPAFPADDAPPLARSVGENSPAGTAVGAPVTADDPDDGDTLTYTLSGADAAAFTIDDTGQIRVRQDAALDHETKESLSLTVNARDGKDAAGDPDTATDASIEVVITVTDRPESPNPVTALTATPLSGYSVRLNWTASDTAGLPPINGVIIDPYQLVQGRRVYLPQAVLEGAQATAVSHTVGGLVPETTYYFEVRVRNTDGLHSTTVEAQTATSANTAPASADFTKNTNNDSDLVFNASDFPFVDPDTGDSLVAVRIVTLPSVSHGVLKWTGSGASQKAVTANQVIVSADLDTLVFTPTAAYVGAAAFTFKVVDSSDAESTAANTITINVQDDGPRFTGTLPLTRSVPENSAAGTDVGAAVTASDPDGDTITFSLSGEDAANFEIGATSGQITVSQDAALDYETQNTHQVTVDIHDGKGPDGAASTLTDASASLTITVTDEIEDPNPPTGLTATVVSPSSIRLDWEASDTTGLPAISFYLIRYGIAAGSSRATTFPDPPTGLTHTITGLVPDTTYHFEIRLANLDGKSSPVRPSVTATTSANLAPTSADFRVYLPAQGRDASFSASDFQFEDADSADRLKQVRIVSLPKSSDGVLKWTPSGGAQTDVTTNRPIDAADLGTLVFDLDDRFTGPTDTRFGPASFTFKVVDQHNAESSETYTATIWNRSPARVVSMKITSVPAVGDTYTLGEVVQVTVGFDKYVVWDLSAEDADIRIQFEEGPSDTWPVASLVTGDRTTAAPRDMVFEFTVAATDSSPDGLRIHPGGGTPIQKVNGATILSEHGAPAVLAYSASQIPARDPNHKVGGSLIPNAAPTFTKSGPLSFSVSEDAAAGTKVGDPVTAIDPDSGDVPTYSLSGADAAFFDINSGTGQISVGANAFLDYEAAKNSYSLTVKVRDGKDHYSRVDNSDDHSIRVTISLTDAKEPSLPPSGMSATVLSSTSIEVEWSAPDNRGRAPATGYELYYRALGEATGTTVTLDVGTFTTTLTGLNPGSSYYIEMRAQNADGFGPWGVVEQSLTTTANARPTSADFTKNTAPGIVLGFSAADFQFNDVDTGDVLKAVTIVALPQAAHGVLKWKDLGVNLKPVPANQLIYDVGLDTLTFTPASDFVGAASFTFMVHDQRFAPSTTHTATINVQQDGARFTETVPITRSIAENSSAGAAVGDAISVTDPDGDTITYSLTGEDADGFTIGADGRIAVGAGTTLDYESAKTSYTMTVEIHDGKDPEGGVSTLTDAYAGLTINVTDLDEPPPAPGGLIVISDSPGTLELTWTAPEAVGRPPVTGYGVEYRKEGATSWTSGLSPSAKSTDTSITISNLTQNADYQVRVWAVNDEGAGDYVSATQNVSPTPRLTGMEIVSDPGDDSYYGLDEEVRIRATFNVGVTVTGRAATPVQSAAWPTMEVDLVNGSSSVVFKTAQLDRKTANGGTTLDFTFTPVTGDDGVAGIRFPRNAISVPAGSTIAGLGQDVTLANFRTAVDASHKVDGVRPIVAGTPAFSSTPSDGQEYQFGEGVSLDVTFSEKVEVAGKPYYGLGSSSGRIRRFQYDSGSGTDTLRFSYTVTASDRGHFSVGNQSIHSDADNLVKDLRGNVFDTGILVPVEDSHPVDGSRIINRAPSLTVDGPLIFGVAEDAPPGTAFGAAITSSDPDGDAVTYTLSGAGASYFAVNAAGQLSVAPGASLDYEALADNALPFSVNISDGRDITGKADAGPDDALDVTVVVRDLNEPPLAPAVLAAPVSSIAVQVGWTAPDNTGRPPISEYQLKYNAGYPRDKVLTFADPATRATTLSLLWPDEDVTISVRAVNGDGEGSWSAPVTVRTLASRSPASRDFTKEVAPGGVVEFSIDDFHFEDPDTGHDPREGLYQVKILTAPGNGVFKLNMRPTDPIIVTDGYGIWRRHLPFLVFETAAGFSTSATFTFKVLDRYGVESESTYTATILAVSNLSPTFSADGALARSVAENSAAGTVVGDPVTATDPENDTLTYALAGPDAGAFDIDSATGQIEVAQGANLDRETKDSYSVTVNASDQKDGQGGADAGIDASVDVAITLSNVVEAPPPPVNVRAAILASTALQISWQAPAPTSAPPVTGYWVSWVEMVVGVPGTDVQSHYAGTETSHTITGLTPGIQYQVKVWSANSDGAGPEVAVDPAPFTAPNSLPTSSDFTNYGPFNFEASDFAFHDADDNEYSMDSLSGVRIVTIPSNLTDDRLRLPSGYVEANQVIPVSELDDLIVGDESLNNERSFTFRVLDSYGGESTQAYRYRLAIPKNLPPAFGEGATTIRHIRENSLPGAAVGAPVEARDGSTRRFPVPTQALTYSLGGEDAASFALDAGTGQLTLAKGVVVDHEVKSLYTVTVDVHDGLDYEAESDTSVDDSIVVEIHVEDVDEPPDGPSNLTADVLSSTSIRLRWEAPDNSGRPPITTYVIASNTGSRHSNCYYGYNTCPDPPTGLSHTFTGLTPGTVYQFNLYSVNDEGASGAGLDQVVSATTHANGLPESADFTKSTRPGITALFGAGDFAFNDADALTDSDDGLAGVRVVTLPEASQGKLKWKAGGGAQADVAAGGLIDHADLGTLVFEAASTFTAPATFTFRVVDRYGGESDSVYTVTMSYALNLQPVFTQAGPLVRTVAENSAAGTEVGEPVTATDPDSGDTVSYALTGADAALFTVDSKGRIKVAAGVDFNYEGDRNTFSLTVNAGDGKDEDGAVDTSMDTSIEVTVNVTNVTESAPAPTGVTVSVRSPGSARVSWQAPDTTGASPIAGYRVLYSTEPAVPYPDAKTILGPLVEAPNLTHELTGLLPRSMHYVKVIAQNAELGTTDLDQAAVTSFTAPINLGPTSADILKGAGSVGQIWFRPEDFPFTDTTPDDYLAYVRIVTLPDSAQGKLRWRADGGDTGDVAAGGLIAADDLYTLNFLPQAGFESTTFTFRVVDRYGAESPVYNAALRIRRGVITGVEISSSPHGDANTYYQHEIVTVGVTYDFPVSWTKPANESIYVALDVGGVTRRAYLRGTGSDLSAQSGGGGTLYFDYQIASLDTDSDGVSVGGGGRAGEKLVEGGLIKATGTNNLSSRTHPGLAADSSHKVDGSQAHNARAQFSQDASLAFEVEENSPAGTAVGTPVKATDADGDTLVYRLEGEDAGLFSVDSDGQITVASGATLDADVKVSFRVSLVVGDGKDDLGRPDPRDTDDSIGVNISIQGVAELPPPISFTVTVLSDTSVRVDWEAPDTTGIPDITHYHVEWILVNTGSVRNIGTQFKSADDRSHTINGLDEGSSYLIVLAARNRDGFGPSRSVRIKTNALPTSAEFEKKALPGTSTGFEASDFPFTDHTQGDSLQSVRIITLPDASHGTLKLVGPDGGQSAVDAGQVIPAARLENLFIETPDDFVDARFTFKVADTFGQYSSAAYTAKVAYPRARITGVSVTSTPRGANSTYYRSEDVVLTVTFSRDVTIDSGKGRAAVPVGVNRDSFPSRDSYPAMIQTTGVATGRIFNFTLRVLPEFGVGEGISIARTDRLLSFWDPVNLTAYQGAWRVTDSAGYAALLDFAGLEAGGDHKVNGVKVHNNPARFSPGGRLDRVLMENSPAGVPVGGGVVTVTAGLDGRTRSTDTRVNVTLSGTAADGTDYTASVPGRITIPAGSRRGTARLLVVPHNDVAREGAETIVVGGAAAGFTVNPATVTLIDDDAASTGITLSLSRTHMPEISSRPVFIAVTATLDNGVARSTDTTVTLSLSGTARRGKPGDYITVAFDDITIPAGQVSATTTLAFRPWADAFVEGAETIVVGGAAAGFTVNSATAIIVDDNTKASGITLSAVPGAVKEDGSGVTAIDIEGDTLTYSLFGAVTPTSFTESEVFEIDPATGVITVRRGVVLDRETRSSYRLTVGVSDGKDPSGATSALECTMPGADPSTDFRACDDLVVVDVTVANVVELQAPPASLTAATESSSTIVLEWSPPPDRGGPPVTGYRLSYAPNAGGGQPEAMALVEEVIEVADGDLLRRVVSNLSPGTGYRFTLQAINSDGDGEPMSVSATTHANSVPDSANFDKSVALTAARVEFAASDFPFTDADAETATGDSLKAVKILSDLQPKTCSGAQCSALLKLDGVTVGEDAEIAFADLGRLQMDLDGEWYLVSTFEFRVIDQYGAESPTYTARIGVADPVVESVSITSNPQSNRTYLNGETVEVSVEFEEPLKWYDDSKDGDGYLYVTLDIGGTKRQAKLSGAENKVDKEAPVSHTPARTDTPYNHWTFSYTVGAGDVDANGVSVAPDVDGNLVRAHGQARLQHAPATALLGTGGKDATPPHVSTAHEGLSDQPDHRVIGSASPNAWPSFDSAPGPVVLTTPENSPSGTAVGDPVTGTDPDGDQLIFSLSGDDVANFDIDSETGRISVAQGAVLDRESKSVYSLMAHVRDGKDPEGGADTAIDASIEVRVELDNVVEKGPPPANPRVTARGSFSLRVAWDHPDSTGMPPPNRYGIAWTEAYRTSYFYRLSVPPDATSATLTNLNPDTAYEIVFWTENDDWEHHYPRRNVYEYSTLPAESTGPNTLPTSADFTVFTAVGAEREISWREFPFSDPDTALTDYEWLSELRIVTLPDPAHGKLVIRVPGWYPERDAVENEKFSFGGVAAYQVVFVPAAGFGGRTGFDFKVVDRFGGESEVSTVTIFVTGDPPEIETLRVVSSPYRHDGVYGHDDIIEVEVAWDREVTWNVPEEDLSSFIGLRLTVGSASRWARPVSTDRHSEEFPASGTAQRIVFAYRVQAADLDPDGVSIRSGVVVHLFGAATLRDVIGQNADRQLDETVTSPHPVNGSLRVNYRPRFIEAGPLNRVVAENTAPGSLLGAPVLAVDPNTGETLAYTLSGPNAADFTIDAGGQIRVGEQTSLDFEKQPNTYSFTVEVSDGKDSLDVANPSVDDAIDMTVTVTNVPEPAGNVTAQVLSAHQIRVTWSAPDSANANYVSSYELAYRELFPKNPSDTGPDRFDEWTTLTFDRHTRQATLEDLQPHSYYDIVLRSVQKGVDAPEVRVTPRPRTHEAPCVNFFNRTHVWQDLHQYVVVRPGPTTLDLAPAPAYLTSGDLKYLNSQTVVCDEQGRMSPASVVGATWLNDPLLDLHAGRFANAFYLDERWYAQPHGRLDPDTRYWYTMTIDGGARGAQSSTYRLVKTTKARTGITLATEPGTVSESTGGATVSVKARMNDNATFHPYYDISMNLTLLDVGTRTTADMAVPQGANSATGEISIPITDDEVVRGPRTVIVSGRLAFPDLKSVFKSSGDFIWGYPTSSAAQNRELSRLPVSSTTVKIEEDDIGLLSIAGPEKVAEGDTAVFTVTLSRQVDAEVLVSWSATGAHATDHSPHSGFVSFPKNQPAGATRTFRIAITDDTLAEPDEQFTVKLFSISSSLSNYLKLDPDASTATVTISDSDRVLIGLTGPAAVAEGSTADYSVTLHRSLDAALTLSYAVSPKGGATAADYTTSAPGTLTFPAGVTTRSIQVTAVDDALHDPDESFTVTISNPRGAAGFEKTLTTGSVTTSITDDDDPIAVTFSVSPDSLSEDDDASSFTITASRPAGVTPAVRINLSLGGDRPGGGRLHGPRSDHHRFF